ncbi:hypothetical protein WI36_09400 [Burkholderia ubonensis]|nr:hypothetical protein WI37_13720 [Burkholderia ubonensis]KUZ78213.1 hypothetical protein WI36_09400 [Burkholderia ubonensis]
MTPGARRRRAEAGGSARRGACAAAGVTPDGFIDATAAIVARSDCIRDVCWRYDAHGPSTRSCARCVTGVRRPANRRIPAR